MISGISKVKGQGGNEGCAFFLAVDLWPPTPREDSFPQKHATLTHFEESPCVGGTGSPGRGPGFSGRSKRSGSARLQDATLHSGFMLTVRLVARPAPPHVDPPKEPESTASVRPPALRPEKTKADEASGLSQKGRGGGGQGEREGEGDGGVVFLLHQTDRKWIIGRAGGSPPQSAAAQGLAGGLGEGQEPWLSKLAVLAFHCGRQGHQERVQRQVGATPTSTQPARAAPSTTYLLLGLLGLQQGVPVCDGLAWVGQHLVPVVPAQSLGAAPDPHHADDLVVADPAVAHARTHAHPERTVNSATSTLPSITRV